MAESQPVDGALQPTLTNESTEEQLEAIVENSSAPTESTATEKSKKKKRKPRKPVSTTNAEASTISSAEQSSNTSIPASKFTPQMMDSVLEHNPALRGELGSMDRSQAEQMLRKMDLSELLTGMSIGGKNQKDMASYKFWATQPVPRFDDKGTKPDGPIDVIDPDKVAREPYGLIEGFEWCELDLDNAEEVREVYELLTFHYVEDDGAMFRFNYSESFLNWALKSPGWVKKWHIGVRATKSRKLVASIFGIPVKLRVRETTLKAVEINFLCIHKKLRSKRLAPLLIKEVTRRCFLEGIYQAIYTAGVVLPKPVGTCRYFHRPLDWLKLYDVGFSPLPPGSTKARMIAKNQVATKTSTPGLRRMKEGDVEAVKDLLDRYLAKFQLAQNLSTDEIEHWLLNKNANKSDAQTVWAYVVENPESKKITDLVSFYCLESSVIKNEGRTDGLEKVRAAYLYYYASESAFAEKEKGYEERLKSLIGDALVEAKKVCISSLHAPTLLNWSPS
jgi:glycylpeptide N-tetradecanoyltransferase